jgi:hypothetical protein
MRNEQWLNRDPIHEWGGIDLYEFVQDNPISWSDILGLDRASCLNDCLNQLTDCLNHNLAQQIGLGGILGLGYKHKTAGGGPKRFCAPGGGPSKYASGLREGGLWGIFGALLYINVDCYSSYLGCRSGCPSDDAPPSPSSPNPNCPPPPPDCNQNAPPSVKGSGRVSCHKQNQNTTVP